MNELLIYSNELGDSAPKEIQILKYGTTTTQEGDYFTDEESINEVLSFYSRRKIDLYFDYNHLSLEPKTVEDGVSAGWYKLEKRQDGLWATDIDWTDRARNYIESKEFRYYSPVIQVRNDKPVRLVNCALTNLPATDNIIPLTLRENLIKRQEKEDLDKLFSYIFK